jgi:predicted Zn-dependent peptidase
MSTELTELHAKLRSKTREILTLVANSYGLGAVSSLEPSRLEQLNEEVEEIIEQHDEALNEGETSEEWRALDERLARTEIGRLLQERHEIAEQILDAEDDEDDDD